MRIFDCFMYSDEDMLLKLRLNELNNFVNKFVISEAKYTHDGKKKELNFDVNNFKDFEKKIEYIVVEDQPPNILIENSDDDKKLKAEKKVINSIRRDIFQREQLAKGLKEARGNDIIIISDLDEIPNLNKINFNEIDNEILVFKQKMFYYKFNLNYENFIWFGTKATKRKNFLSPQWMRNIKNKKYPFWRIDTFFSKNKYTNIKFVEDGGWHFTCIKNPEDVQKKLLSFAHHQDFEDSNISLDDLKKRMSEKKVLYNHRLDQKNKNKWKSSISLKKINIKSLPSQIQKNEKIYTEWLEK